MADEAKKKKKPFLTIGVPGKPIGGAAVTKPGTAKPVTSPTPTGSTPISLQQQAPAMTGRPKSNLGQYLIKPDADSMSGFEMLNATPDIMSSVNARLSAFELPPALQPKYLRRPAVMDTNRGKNISRGWRHPRTHRAG